MRWHFERLVSAETSCRWCRITLSCNSPGMMRWMPELEGVILGLELSLDYFRTSKNRQQSTFFVTALLQLTSLLTDCYPRFVLKCFKDWLFWGWTWQLLGFLVITELNLTRLQIILRKKQPVIFIQEGCLLLVTSLLMIQSKVSAEIARRSWQTKWDQDSTSFYTRHLIPEVGIKVFLPEKRDIRISYCC